jgi:hypothetical protein
MHPGAHVLDRLVLRGRQPSTAGTTARRDRRRRVPVRRFHLLLVLLAVTVGALVALPGWGAGTQPSCRGTVLTGEFACLNGQQPQQADRSCVVYSSAHTIDFWRCTRKK